MATKTQYYNLDKPSYDEVADIEIVNANMDKIDTQMRNNADGVNFSKGISSDAYDNSKSYAVGDYCIYDNKLYRCITAIESAEAFNIAKWEQTTVGNEVNQLNSNLTQLEYSDVAGGKNKFDNSQPLSVGLYDYSGNLNINYYHKVVKVKPNTRYSISSSEPFGTGYYLTYMNGEQFIGSDSNLAVDNYSFIITTPSNCDNIWVYENIIYNNFQIEEGTTATPYEPYIPSVKMLNDDLAIKNITSQLAYNEDVVSDLSVFRAGNIVEVYFVVNADSNKLNIISGLPKSASRYSICPVFNNVSPYKPVDASVWISNNVIHLYTSSQITDGYVSLKYICE